MKRAALLKMPQYLGPLSKLYVLSMILALDGSYAADYLYEACGPRNCGNGPNISYPFYIGGLQESSCGYPGFMLNCSKNGYPVLQLSETEYLIEDIFYESRYFRVYNSAFSSFNKSSNCLPRIRNTTALPTAPFYFAYNVTNLHLFSNCNDHLSENMSFCDGSRVLALYGDDEKVENAVGNCGTNLVAPVENDGNMGLGSLVQALRRGFVINWRDSYCSECRMSGGYCGFNNTGYHFMCFCSDRPHSGSCTPLRKHISLRLILGSVFGAVLVVTTVLILLILTRIRKRMMRASVDKNIEVFLKRHQNLAPRRYRYSELKKITKSFNEKLGQGGYGSVYKAKLKDGRFVAVKLLNESKSNGEEFINEVASISTTSHINVVTLLGFCFEGSKRALVYEFMPNGSLDKFIGKASLPAPVVQLGWEKLYDIVVGIARGLEYLHRGCHMQILHLDIKPHNILLDKDFQPKIADFGLAKLCPNRASSIISMSEARGTVGYIAPEVFCRNFGNVSHKSDVYSYGMMVLDIVGERENGNLGSHNTSEKYFPHWIYEHLELDGDQSVDDDDDDDDDEWRLKKRKLTIVGLWCVQTDPKDRPSMNKVVEMLQGGLDSLPIPPKPCLSSPIGSSIGASLSESSHSLLP